jgi:hypothetical protein
MAMRNHVYLTFTIQATHSELSKRGTSNITEEAPKTYLQIMHVFYKFAYVENYKPDDDAKYRSYTDVIQA